MNTSPTVGIVSLGCPKALVDSERIITQLRAEGYALTGSYEAADLVIINTCGFIEDAVTESLDSIGEALTKNGRVIVTGCLGKKEDLIRKRFPQVLHVTGPHAYEEVLTAVHEHLPPQHDPFQSLLPPQGLKLTPRHYAYLKISEGCNHKCTFCIIPDLRGKLQSRKIGEVMNEAESLANAGVKELLIISQDTSAYGVDLKYPLDFWQGRPLKTKFYDLAHALSHFNIWVRLHYVYPYPHVDEVIPLMAEGKLLPYLDIPLQHASQRILKLMRRPASSEDNLKRILSWRGLCPELAIRSTFIVGFPGETSADFEELLEFLEAAQLDRVGCFTYSPVAGARANELPNAIPEEIKKERYERLMALQAQISADKLARQVGKKVKVLVDEIQEDYALARSSADAPGIDGIVYVVPHPTLKVGEFYEVQVVAADNYDLQAEVIE